MSYYFDNMFGRVSESQGRFIVDVLTEGPNRLVGTDREIYTDIMDEALRNPQSLYDHGAQDPEWIMRHFPDCSIELFRELYQLGSLISKFSPPDVAGDAKRRRLALEKLTSTEEQCSYTNGMLYDGWCKPYEEGYRSMLLHAQSLIKQVLGDVPSEEEIFSQCGFGPGASCSLPRRRGDAFFKFGNPNPTATHNLRPFIDGSLSGLFPLWGRQIAGVRYVDGNEVTTVPKSTKIDRTIAIEPDVNQFLQRGIGSSIRHRLMARAGINLNNQDLNQILAFAGSLDDDLATLDLSSASDSVSTELTLLLMPKKWGELLMAVRSPIGVLRHIPGETKQSWVWEKTSSMGNGYTFELESLIFWALARAAVYRSGSLERRLGVYGDDIIVPAESAGLLVQLLEFCGFTVNTQKSFTKGPFRESCGKHYYRGGDVTPLYIRKDVKDPLVAACYHNLSIARGMLNHDGEWQCPHWSATAFRLRSRVPRRWNVPVPADKGHCGFWTSWDSARPVVRRWRRKMGYDTWYTYSSLVPQFTEALVEEGEAALCKNLYLLDKRNGPTETEQSWGAPDKSSGVKLKRVTARTLGWSDLPPLRLTESQVSGLQNPRDVIWEAIPSASSVTTPQE